MGSEMCIRDSLESDVLPSEDYAARKLLLMGDSSYIELDGLLYHLGSNQKGNSWDSFPQLVVPSAVRFQILFNMRDHVLLPFLGSIRRS